MDAFASEPFRGNPAGVCFLDNEVGDDWMRSVAAEMKHAETAFVLPRFDGSYDLRWWTPEVEVPLCGHATLASAHALWETGRLDAAKDAVFHTKSGELHATRLEDGRVVLDFPVAELQPADDEPGVEAAIGIAPVRVVRTPFFMLAELADADALRTLAPDLDAGAQGRRRRAARHRARGRGRRGTRRREPGVRPAGRDPRGFRDRLGDVRARAVLAGPTRSGAARRPAVGAGRRARWTP